MDLTHWRLLWIRFSLAAILDGFSRKLLALKIYPYTPTSAHLLRLMRRAIQVHGQPRFLITDHGCQFRKRFRDALKHRLRVTLIKGPVRSPCFNGKIERFFRTFKLWQRLALLGLRAGTIQHRLDIYRDWYNTQRPMPVLGGWTPEQVHRRQPPLKAVPIRARDPAPVLRVVKWDYGGDPYLPVIEIPFAESSRAVA